MRCRTVRFHHADVKIDISAHQGHVRQGERTCVDQGRVDQLSRLANLYAGLIRPGNSRHLSGLDIRLKAGFRHQLNAGDLRAAKQGRIDVDLPNLRPHFPLFKNVFSVGVQVLCAASPVVIRQNEIAAQRPVRKVNPCPQISLGITAAPARAVLVNVTEGAIVD